MKKVRVWFNRWFSVAYHYMNLIRHNPDGLEFEMYGTHPDIRHMSLQACDHAETEPELKGDAYVEFALQFCRQHGIDVFIPRLHMLDIAKHVDAFAELGTKVIVCSDVELLNALMHKDRFYEMVRPAGILAVPDYYVAQDADAFRTAYEELSGRGHRVCFKPTSAEGGVGFRVIDNARDPLDDLLGPLSRSVTFDEAYRALSAAGSFAPLMVMEHLDGYEYSIDCLASPEGHLIAAVPRRKAGGRLRLLENVPELLDIAAKVAAAYRIPYNYNIQMKYANGVPKLLEINPRMSGGLHVSCLSGVNFPYLAVRMALGLEVPAVRPKFGILASHIEHPMMMCSF
ncbi:ATP-grasp domain-containing protein [Paenibacillus athensensis]|uniref:Carbamoyl-phosphate synthase large subunit n=1 Tax=Paenibacillus athensensis TaxID=1967502 RepID=A0A4Y8PXE0_9BACL|nr:ATP-grasp domain-containing protein [Paenibacillus athensensis]MCD1261478.1 ATP-grasp domain-containing protein [Paenibacillus athensensis]